jgi:uncharacterized protein YyaL (SSP411 family)
MPNRLARSNSPYLLQHAENPVDWYPWGEEAFAKARAEDRPIFLSIGYATCHWCHVMEHESFEDADVARLMNEAFVSVKVDREERPDVDGVYMDVCQAMTGHGGWPLTILMTPEGRPFFAATYLPRESLRGRVGMLDLVPGVQKLWSEDRARLLADADEIARVLGRQRSEEGAEAGGAPLGRETLDQGFAQLSARYDAEFGGFGGAPKFPTPHTLLFLLRYWKRSGEGRALAMVEKTLRAMRRGGLWDHVGFGFHRYATDARWLLPHFEKMLYDQALLCTAYTEAHRATGDPFYRAVAERTIEYVARDLTSPEGAFYSAEDADSLDRAGHREEGAFYTWTEDDLHAAVGDTDFRFARAVWGTDPEGNVEDEASRRKTGQNVLHHPEPFPDLADRFGLGEGALREKIDDLRLRLLDARAVRPRPLLDDKVLTDWNGLMLVALARAARAFGERRHAERGGSAADFLLRTMRTPDGGLLHRYRNGEAAVPGFLDDYAFLAWGLIELYQALYDERYLTAALELHREAERRFLDEAAGDFYFTEAGGEPLLFRRKEHYDGAVPSGNAVAMHNGLRLGRITGDVAMERRAERVAAASPEVAQYPAAHAYHLVALDYAVGPAQEVVVAGERAAPDTLAMLDRLGRIYAPNAVFLLRAPGAGEAPVTALAPATAAQTARDGRATAYVCERFACQSPTTDPEQAVRLLQGLPT